MKVYCPNCRALVLAADISLATGWGKCAACNEVFSLEQVLPNFRAAASVEEASAKPLERPFNAIALVERTPREFHVHIPASGMKAAHWGMALFATFWLGFIAFWTLGASGLLMGEKPNAGNLVFAAFSIPFWIVGFGMAGAVVWGALGTTGVSLNSMELQTRRRCWFWARTRSIESSRVQHARPYVSKVKSDVPTRAFGVEIVYEKGSFVLPIESEEESTWLIAEINQFLEKLPRTSRPKGRDDADFGVRSSKDYAPFPRGRERF